LLPINAAMQFYQTRATVANTMALNAKTAAEVKSTATTPGYLAAMRAKIVALYQSATAWQVNWIAMTAGIAGIAIVIAGFMSMKDPLKAITLVALGLAAAFGAMWVAGTGGAAAAPILAGLAAVSGAIAAAGAIGMGLRSSGMTGETGKGWMGKSGTGGAGVSAPGGPYDAGFVTSGPVQGAGIGGGVTINIGGSVYDKEGFSEVLAESLPGAHRRISDLGGA